MLGEAGGCEPPPDLRSEVGAAAMACPDDGRVLRGQLRQRVDHALLVAISDVSEDAAQEHPAGGNGIGVDIRSSPRPRRSLRCGRAWQPRLVGERGRRAPDRARPAGPAHATHVDAPPVPSYLSLNSRECPRVAPGSHDHANRDHARRSARHANPHRCTRSRMSRPPHVHGKEGVDGSSPSEGFAKPPQMSGFLRLFVVRVGDVKSHRGRTPQLAAAFRP
jgi:hypothetical protein